MKILEMGGGHQIFPFDETKNEVVRIDWNPRGADIVHNLSEFPYPFEDSSFDIIYSSHCIEHVENKNLVLWEIHRILKKGGVAIIRVPHMSSSNAWNFDHLHMWRVGSMNCFVNADWYGGGSFPRFELLSERLNWRNLNPIRLFKNTAEEFCDLSTVAKGRALYKLRHKIVNMITNRHKHFTEMFLYYWLLGIDEIEYRIKAVK